MYKVGAFTAIITPPQSAILAVGAIADAVVPWMESPASGDDDHDAFERSSRGGWSTAAEFLGELAGAIREPEKWL